MRNRNWISILTAHDLCGLRPYPDDARAFGDTFKFDREHMPNSPLDLSIPYLECTDVNSTGIDFFYENGVDQRYRNGNYFLQCADQLTLCWATKGSSKLSKLGFDETVGCFVPDFITDSSHVEYDTDFNGVPKQTGYFYAYECTPKESVAPSLICIGGLRRWYSGGTFHKDNGPAITADYVGAVWYSYGKEKRVNGPSAILIDDYKGYYENGNFVEHKYSNISERWINKSAYSPVSDVNPLCNQYFSDPQDEMCHLAEIAA